VGPAGCPGAFPCSSLNDSRLMSPKSKGIYDPSAAKRFALSAASSSSSEAASSILSAASEAGDSISSFLTSYLSSVKEASKTATLTSVPFESGTVASGTADHGVTSHFPTPTAGDSVGDGGGDISTSSTSKTHLSSTVILGIVLGCLSLLATMITVIRRMGQDQGSSALRQTATTYHTPTMATTYGSGANTSTTAYRSSYNWTPNQTPRTHVRLQCLSSTLRSV
jgi:hypothetical protein